MWVCGCVGVCGCVYVCLRVIYVYMHTYTTNKHAHTHTYIHIHIYTYINTHTHCIRTCRLHADAHTYCTHTFTYKRITVCIHTYIQADRGGYIHMYTIYECMCAFAYIRMYLSVYQGRTANTQIIHGLSGKHACDAILPIGRIHIHQVDLNNSHGSLAAFSVHDRTKLY